MDFLSPLLVHGDKVELARTHPNHLDASGKQAIKARSRSGDFAAELAQALNGVNDLQQASAYLSQRMVVDPDSVDPHDVSIAMAKANLTLSMTKAIVDRAIRAYKEITSIR